MDEFMECISDLLLLDDVQKLKNYKHHLSVNRLNHSINVSYYSYVCAKKFGYDYISAARGGLLHDLFYDEYKNRIRSLRAHGRDALRNANKICDLNDIEKDIILKHMWPITLDLPIYKESYLVAAIDDYCSIFEISTRLSKIFMKSSNQFTHLLKQRRKSIQTI
jgi:uncharacterized protein